MTLTPAAQSHVNLTGLRPRIAMLLERRAQLLLMQPGDRVALAPETPSHDLTVAARRHVVDPREMVLEILLDYPGR